MIDHEPADIPPRLAELASNPEAPRWAADCAWVPGTGHCRNRPCSEDCLFREQRTAEAERIVQLRRQRRAVQRGRAGRLARFSDPQLRALIPLFVVALRVAVGLLIGDAIVAL